jgi:CBS domain-containing protein
MSALDSVSTASPPRRDGHGGARSGYQVEGGRLVGILTESDFVRALAEAAGAA